MAAVLDMNVEERAEKELMEVAQGFLGKMAA